MGGPGAGHKSVRATQSRLENIQKARAARKRAPLPWRSGMESRIIEQLVWQWWMSTASHEWLATSGETTIKAKADSSVAAPFVHVPLSRQTGHAPRNDSVRRNGEWSVKSARNDAARPWAKYRVARFLGVSHTWVNKLVKRFEKDPDRMRRRMAAFAPASIEKLEQAREETRRQRERGWLRGPIRYRRVKVSLQGRKRKVMVPTRTAVTSREWSVASKQRQMPQKQSVMPVAYREVPEWAKGLLLPGDAGTSTGHVGGRRTPRPVPFAFRRRR